MSPEERAYIKAEVEKVNEQFIRDNFNLDEHRQNIRCCLNTVDILDLLNHKFHSDISLNEFFAFMNELILTQGPKTVNEQSFITVEIHYESSELILSNYEYTPEEDEQVIYRLIRKEQDELKRALKTKFDAPGKQARLEAQRKTLANKKAKQEQEELEAAAKLLRKKGFVVST